MSIVTQRNASGANQIWGCSKGFHSQLRLRSGSVKKKEIRQNHPSEGSLEAPATAIVTEPPEDPEEKGRNG